MLNSLIGSRFRLMSMPAPCWINRTALIRQIGVAAFVVSLLMNYSLVLAAGTWTPVTTNNPAGGCGTMMLLTDGTVMVLGGDSQSYTRLTADSSGNYINGTWSNITAMGKARLYVGSNVLPNGNVFVLGGEYSGSNLSANWTNTGEIYDVRLNTWSSIPNFPESEFGDDPTVLLADGTILCGYLSGPQTYLFDTNTKTWSQTGSRASDSASDEETWMLLPDGSVLAYDIFRSAASSGDGYAQRYIPSTKTWVDTGRVPVRLTSSSLGYELGPATLLPDGRVFQVGANNNTAFYTPSTDTWAQGPSLPLGMGADDAPGAMLPNGHFIFAADSPLFKSPTKLFDLDPVANTLTNVTPAGTLGNILAGNSAYVTRMLVLPNGHLLLSTGNSQLWDYAPDGSPMPAWAPTITSVVNLTGTTYTLTGTKLTGISEGATYGDDAEMSSNYPIVRFTSSSNVVKYATTHDWTPSVSNVSNTTSMTAQFDLPTLANGTYQLVTIANGIASASATATVVNNVITNVVINGGGGGGGTDTQVAVTLSSSTLTLTGDGGKNEFTVTQNFSAGTLVITAATGTKVNGKSSETFTGLGINQSLVVNGDLGGGDDKVIFEALNSTTFHLLLGDGNDLATFKLCFINDFFLDGGAGVLDAFVNVGSRLGRNRRLSKTQGFP